ncbi:hypothetical protein Lpp226_1710 [Lacticaseibacillus paracasei subsp. paracasei Lpp226]|nr:hypothetical protein Lpp226_1710 [Lacticaseibacillus paracasei subsp. paracasei Lpp226]
MGEYGAAKDFSNEMVISGFVDYEYRDQPDLAVNNDLYA